MTGQSAPSLTIVIPALNEEDAIGSTISRCLEARQQIIQEGGVESVEIIVVSDGSTDRTVEIARSFDEIKLIVFPLNRGYGAAIKEGFAQGTGSLVGFLDADGTCDPRYFAELCRAIIPDRAEVALGSRMGPGSKMPKLRRLGNRIFAGLLGIFCGKFITDSASGMRVMRRDSLPILYPLPDGLDFTPAMSGRALLGGLRVIEIPMSYEERLGRSKLSVLRDGWRFLKAIFGSVLCYRPERVFLMIFAICLIVTLLIGLHPLEYYLHQNQVQEWTIHRFLLGLLLGSGGFLSLCAAALAHDMSQLGPRRLEGDGFWAGTVSRLFSASRLCWFAGFALAFAILLLGRGAISSLFSGTVEMHWSRVMIGLFALMLAFQAGVTAILLKTLSIWRSQHQPDAKLAGTRDTRADNSAGEMRLEETHPLPAKAGN